MGIVSSNSTETANFSKNISSQFTLYNPNVENKIKYSNLIGADTV